MICNRNWLAVLALYTGALCASSASATDPASLVTRGEVYRTPEGQNFAALSVQLPEAQGTSREAEQVLVLVDTSASQVGSYRKQSLAVTSQLLEKLSGEQLAALKAEFADPACNRKELARRYGIGRATLYRLVSEA